MSGAPSPPGSEREALHRAAEALERVAAALTASDGAGDDRLLALAREALALSEEVVERLPAAIREAEDEAMEPITPDAGE